MSTESTKETPRQRLERLRVEYANLLADEAAGAPAQLRLPTPGSVVHCVVSGTTISTGGGWLAGGAVLARGASLVITSALLEANRDASGRYWGPGLALDEQAQLDAYGKVLFRDGPAPADMTAEPGTSEWVEQREVSRRAAWAEPDPGRRAAALAEVERKYGPAPLTSATLNTSPDPSIAAAAAQRAELDAGGVRLRSHYEAVEPEARR